MVECNEIISITLLIVFIVNNAVLFGMGIGLISVGALAGDLSNINTENIKPLLDLFTEDSHVGMINALSISLIIIGAFTLLAVVLSIAGVFRQNKFILIEFANLVLILFVVKIVVIVLWNSMKSKVETDMQSKMVSNLKYQFVEDTTTNSNPLSNAWNYLHMTLDCCGVNAVESTTNDFDATSWCTTSGSCQATSSQIPKTCCLNVDENTYSSAPSGCHASVNSGTYNAKGCYAALKEELLDHSTNIIGLLIATIIFEILAVIFTILIRQQDRELFPDPFRKMFMSSSVDVQ